jgi:hypothetical protein
MNHTMHNNEKKSISMLDLIVNLDLRFWKMLTTSTPKQTNLETSSSFFKTLCVIKEFTIDKVKWSFLNLQNICWTFDNKGI